MFNFQIDWLNKWAVYTPGKMFLREHNRDISWSAKNFNERANSLANYFTDELKLKKGDRVAIYSKNRAEYVLIFCACVKTGIIMVPLNFRLTPRELNTLISDAAPSLFLYEREYADIVNTQSIVSLQNIPLKLEIESLEKFLIDSVTDISFTPKAIQTEDDVVMVLYTSGTTGFSKGVMINHRMLFWNAVNTALRLDITSSDHTQSYAPFFHTGGWNVLFTPFMHYGASHTILQNFDAELILKLMEKEKTTILFGVPTMLKMMSDTKIFNKVDLSSVRYAVVGGAPMPIPLINTWHEKGIFIRQGYGLTEVGPNCFSLHQDDAIRKKGSIGFPNFYVDAKIVSDDEKELGANETGELWMKSPIVTPGYWRKEEETAKSKTDGWFHTGDMVRRDEDGYYYVVDRKKNMFISGGENVYPAEVERFLYTHPNIIDASVIGVADEKWGEVGKAYIVKQKDSNLYEPDVIEFCKGNLAKYKTPKYIEFIDELPKNDAGKIDKKALLTKHLTL